MKALTIAGNELRRFARFPIGLLLSLALPMAFVFVAGAGGSADPRVGLAVEDDGQLAGELAAAIRAVDGVIVLDEKRDALVAKVNRSDLDAGVVIPAGYDAALRSGQSIDVEYLLATEFESDVAGVIGAEVEAMSARVRAASLAATETGVPFAEAWVAAAAAAEAVPATGVRLAGPHGTDPGVGSGPVYDISVNVLLLFVFITAIASAGMLVEARQLRLGHRMLATPTGPATIVGGALLGRFVISAAQGTIIVIATAALFGAEWGNLPGALAVVLMFGLVGAGAGLLGGALFRTEQMAYGVGIGLGIAFIYLTQLDPYSALSPHSWAWDALDELAGGGGFAGVLPELGVLALFAAALAMLASWRFHRAITT